MSRQQTEQERIAVPEAPAIPGLVFRRFRGEADYPDIVEIAEGCKKADGFHETTTLEEIAQYYSRLVNCDPVQDMLFAEIQGQAVGYGRVWWKKKLDGATLYGHLNRLLPAWRGKGIHRAMLYHSERRLRQIAAGHPWDGPRFFDVWASDAQKSWAAILAGEGYTVVQHSFEMVRPHLEEIPDLPLPEGLEVRPVQPEHLRAIWDAEKEAFQDDSSYSEDDWTDERFAKWQRDPTLDPSLWQVAWDGEQAAGMVRNLVNAEENEEYGRRRGYTEYISVRRPWRRRGLARALIARSFHVLRDLGMTEAALGVDAQNPNGALRLYESMGFRTVMRFDNHRKRLE